MMCTSLTRRTSRQIVFPENPVTPANFMTVDIWCHQGGSVLKHVSASSSDRPQEVNEADEEKVENIDMKPSTVQLEKSKGRKNYQDQALQIMGQLVENNKDMA